jgi:YHS domain-containing protein
MKKVGLSLFIALAFALSSGVVYSFAAEGSHMEGDMMDGSHMEAGKADVAIDGYCPVCITKGKYVKGSPKFSTEYKGKVYYFPGFDQQKMFINDPETYIMDLEKKYQDLKKQAEGSPMMKDSPMKKDSSMPEGSH